MAGAGGNYYNVLIVEDLTPVVASGADLTITTTRPLVDRDIVRWSQADQAFNYSPLELQEASDFALNDLEATLIFPSKTDTFGIVLIEALAAGLPIAAYKVPGPIDITGGTEIDTLDDDLKTSALKALKIDKQKCRKLAKQYTWEECAKIFESVCVPNY